MISNNSQGIIRLFLILLLAIAGIGASADSGAKCHPLPLKPIDSEDIAIATAKEAVQVYKLTSLTNECLNFEASTSPTKSGYVINVREKHSSECGGNPMVEPRLFSFQVSPTGKLMTDAYTTDMKFEPLSCKRKALGY